VPLPADTATSAEGTAISNPAAENAFEEMWDEEWRRNLIDAAMEKVKRMVHPQHYQIFYLHSIKHLPAREIGQLLGVSVAKVYVVRHRVARLVKRHLRSLENSCQ